MLTNLVDVSEAVCMGLALLFLLFGGFKVKPQ